MTLSIILHCIARVDLPVFIINILGFLFASIFTFMPKRPTGAVGDTLISEMLLFIYHLQYCLMAFTLTFVFAILYLVLYRLLKRKVVAFMD